MFGGSVVVQCSLLIWYKMRWVKGTWVVLQRGFAVRLFDLVRSRVALESKDLVWVDDRGLGLHVVFNVRHVWLLCGRCTWKLSRISKVKEDEMAGRDSGDAFHLEVEPASVPVRRQGPGSIQFRALHTCNSTSVSSFS